MPASRYEPTDRRPIASRRSPIWISLSKQMARAGVSPNAVSVAGMLACLAAGACLYMTGRSESWTERALWVAGAIFCQLRLLANLLDGMVAIERGVASPVGELYNEVPDRVSDAAVFIGLGYAAGAHPALGYLAALMSIFVAYIRTAVKLAGAPQDYRGPMAKQHRMFVVTVLALFMGAAPVSWRQIAWSSRTFSIPDIALGIVIAGCAITAWRRLSHAAALLRTRTS